MTVITRFAPSPTGFLHIGGARTALFNWLFARHHGGKFLLRIEDTDKKRSTQEAIDAILDGMEWLGLNWDDEVIYQSKGAGRHAAAAHKLLDEGKAYRCYCTPEELAELREQAQKEGKAFQYDRRWRDRDPSEAPEGVDPVIRLKAPLEGETVVNDLVQGEVRVPNSDLDDMVLLRSDGSPTYMLAVVVDDHDMGITHAIRGDDHLTNAFRQKVIYEALGWDVPEFAHIPLIHGPDGAKMSKRHGALGVESYRDMGYLPEALRNYLLRLGWSHGDDEIISTAQAVKWFTLDNVGRSPARFDFDKLASVNQHYLKEADNARLAELIVPLLEGKTGQMLNDTIKARLVRGMEGLKSRAKTLPELAEGAVFYVARPEEWTDKAVKALDDEGKTLLSGLLENLGALGEWNHDALEQAVQSFAEAQDTKLGKVAQPLRAAITASHISPSMFEVMAVLGKEETIARLRSIP